MKSTREATGNGSRSPLFDVARWRGQVCAYSGHVAHYGANGTQWEDLADPPAGETCGYGEFSPDREGRYFLSDFLSGSDYSGSLVERSNYREFLETFGEREGVHEVSEGYGTFAVAVRIDAVDEEMAEVFDRLEDYPLLSEDAHCEMEVEAQGEAWDSWARSDFVRELEARFSEEGFGELVYVPHGEAEGQGKLFETGERPKPSDLDEAVCRLFETAREDANVYWENESGGEVYIDLERVCDAVTAEMLEAHCLRVEE